MKLPLFVVARKLRRRVMMEHTPLNRFQVRLAQNADEYWGAFRLVQSAYVAAGIENALSDAVRILPQHVLPEAYVLIATEGDQLVGTMTVTFDSPAGLPLDKDYPTQINDLRAQKLRLAEFGSLAVVERCRHSGVNNLMIMAAFTLATRPLAADRVVIGVNPGATDHFRACYHFDLLGGAKTHAALVAPVTGLVTNLHTLKAFLRSAYPMPLSNGALPVEHFFGEPLSCITLPEGTHEELVRRKLSREVFQELFLRRTDRIATLDATTRDYLELLRTPGTFGSVPASSLKSLIDLRHRRTAR